MAVTMFTNDVTPNDVTMTPNGWALFQMNVNKAVSMIPNIMTMIPNYFTMIPNDCEQDCGPDSKWYDMIPIDVTMIPNDCDHHSKWLWHFKWLCHH